MMYKFRDPIQRYDFRVAATDAAEAWALGYQHMKQRKVFASYRLQLVEEVPVEEACA
jgi:hypothetical protein